MTTFTITTTVEILDKPALVAADAVSVIVGEIGELLSNHSEVRDVIGVVSTTATFKRRF